LIVTPGDSGVFYHLLDGETVSGAAYSLNQVISTILAQDLAQSQYMHINCALLDEAVSPPDGIQQLASTEDTLGVGHEVA
jgi:hypothetical protein